MIYPRLPIPDHFDPEALTSFWKVPYDKRAAGAERWAEKHGVPPAAADRTRICLVAVDVQNTFCLPGFELFVSGSSGQGAVDDNRRLCEFIYRNLGAITTIFPTLDSHQALQIFHSLFLVDAEGSHPPPMTQVTAAEVEEGRWRVDARAAAAIGMKPEEANRFLDHYTRRLEASGKFSLTIWPYHAMLGGLGHALVSSVEEAIFFHSVARFARVGFEIKGANPLTEHYSVLGPEITEGPDGDQIAEHNEELVETLLAFDVVIIAGQAKSHCVAWTIDDLLRGIDRRDRDLARRVYLLEDCTSPVVVSGIVDYTESANLAFERFSQAGMHIVRSTTPINEWPDLGKATLARA